MRHFNIILPLAATATLLAALTSCSIEPPLKLAGEHDVEVVLPEIITDINVIWDIDTDWHTEWWYGWDDTDRSLSGEIEYPEPTNFEARIYYIGEDQHAAWSDLSTHTIYGNSFRRRFATGYHDMLLWSNIDSHDGTQVLRIDETSPDSIIASTSPDRLPYATYSVSRTSVYNNPEIFYGNTNDRVHISHDPADYDYFDNERQVWVKSLKEELQPMVYTYLVQIVFYNNHGRVTGTADRAGMTSLADAVCIHDGHTSLRDITVTYDMRMKKEIPARDGINADILGGKLTTFGLCDLEPWSKSRSSRYSGSRTDLLNHVMVDLTFNNASDSTYFFEVTPQMQSKVHGGIITIEIDTDTLKIPKPGTTTGGSSFNPTVVDRDNVDFEFGM